jgi:hypothetical protein
MKKFADFNVDAKPLDGEKIRLDDILNIEITVIGYNIRKSKYGKNVSGKCLALQVEYCGKRRLVFTGSDVLIGQLERYGEQIPFVATIRKIDRYYTLS